MNHWIAKITAAAKRLSTPQEAMVLYLLAGTLGLLYGCASTPDSVYKLYPGPARPDSEIVTLHLGSATEAVIDGMKVSYGDYGSVELLPGPHEIQWKAWFAFSVLVEPSGFSTRKSNLFVELKAGHAYILKADRTTGHGYRTYLWIEDADSGEVIAGRKKP